MTKKSFFYCLLFILVLQSFGCQTSQVQKNTDTTEADNEYFLNKAEVSDPDEIFRVVIMSDKYIVVQKSAQETISRVADISGDKYISDELVRLDKINEVRESVLTVSLYPDSGRIMKIRPKQLSALIEVERILGEDLQRWSFISPKKRTISPLKFNVRYRVILRKKQSDDEIIKEVREKMKEKS